MPEHFSVSPSFTGADRKVVEEAVRQSSLPEGIHIVKGHEIGTAEKPFVVITWSPDAKEAIKAFHAGATDYVRARRNVEDLVEDLSSHGQH